MGIENYEVIIATTWSAALIEEAKRWIHELPLPWQSLFVIVPSLVNKKSTIIFAPDGGMKEWGIAQNGAALREGFKHFLAQQTDEDGASPWAWVEVGYGEFGQKVLAGNCTNKYSDAEYAE